MAISGAAANPHAGGGGSGWTKNRAVSIVMSMLSLRLGYWAPNPNPKRDRGVIPNFINARHHCDIPVAAIARRI